MKQGTALASRPWGAPRAVRTDVTWHMAWTRARRAAAALVLVYLVVGVAIPWLLIEAPPLPYVVAAAPEHCNHPSASPDPCRASRPQSAGGVQNRLGVRHLAGDR